MGFFRYLTLLFCLCTITLTQAQRYEVDCLVSSEIKAVATDKPTEFDGTRTVLYLRNGTLVNVVGRKVAGTDGQEASHLKQAGDTLDVGQIKAVVEYDGKHYLAEARWLKFSDQNPESATDIFAADNFRPRSQLTDWLNLSHIGLHSVAMRAVYSPILPIVALLLMVAAVWMALRTRFLLLSALPFVASISILVFMALMVDWDALWWCNPDYVGLPKAIGGIIPVALFVALAFCYFFSVTTFAKGSFSVWPIVVGYLAQWPMMMLSLHLAGSVWPAIVVCYGIPMLFNGFRTRLYGVVMTVVGIVALHALVVALAVTVQVSLWILMALCIASPLIGFFVTAGIGKFSNAYKQKWVVRDGKLQNVSILHQGDRIVE